jgi:hypothetical protein
MATVTNYEERLTTAFEGLALANGGDLPARNSVNSDQEYRLKLAEAAADGAVGGATFTIGAEAGNVINVAIQLTDGNGNNLAHAAGVRFYLAADSAGQTIGTAVDTLAIGTNGLYQQLSAGLSGFLTSEANGLIDVNLTETDTATRYMVLVLPNGSLAISGAITFA